MTKYSRSLRLLCSSLSVAMVLLVAVLSHAQTESATMSGTVMDRSGAVVADAKVEVTNSDTNIGLATRTNKSGIYVVTGLRPGRYRMAVTKEGFRSVVVTDITLNVQDTVSRNFNLDVGAFSESITVTADQTNINTTDATVSTVVDRNFAENLPMNGRSFQTLIQLTPGVALTPSTNTENGQFSVNGQRSSSNYWMVDGVGANVGLSSTNQVGNGISGAQASLSVMGGTNSLVSVDALQEFRVQTSTYAPEFGRTPGGQISIATRSGTNSFHGTTFEYLRNDILDANDWFADNAGLSKPKERQNDFGGTLSGPVLKDHTFFFFSYEGLRLRLPTVVQARVPDLSARQNALPAIEPFLNAYPLPNGTDNLATGVAEFNTSYSNSAALDAVSLRIDHRLSNKLALFGRYSYSPSSLAQRIGLNCCHSLSDLVEAKTKLQTATGGVTWAISPTAVADLRINYSRANGTSVSNSDDFGGAVPLTSLPLPSPYNSGNSSFQFLILGLSPLGPNVGLQGQNLQRQVNVVDNLSLQKGSHTFKFGADYRRLSPIYGNPAYDQEVLFRNVAAAEQGTPLFTAVSSTRTGTLLFRNLGVFAQDTWRVLPRLTLTYGIRWDLDVAPSSKPALAAVTGFDKTDLSKLALATPGTPPFKTTYGNFAPRLGFAYGLHQNQSSQTVLRGGFGVFYDLASSEIGNLLYYYFYPFGSFKFLPGGTFPLNATDAAPPPITTDSLTSGAGVFAFDPNTKLPYTLEWNMAIEQSLGTQQAISASYIGAAGRRLTRTTDVVAPNPNFSEMNLVTNAGTSNYNALQVQFRRRLSRGLQVLGSYSWSHSIDDASAGATFESSLLTGVFNSNRASSDFDIRHSFSAGVTYEIPAPKLNTLMNAVLHDWSSENFITVRSAPPVTLFDGAFYYIKNDYNEPRPDLVPGQPLYLYGSQYPGGKAFNSAAFTDPPVDPNTGNLARQGTTPRNLLRGFGAAQWDFAVHRDFSILESLKLQFRAEMFNVLNHPNFAPPVADISNTTQFGHSVETLGNYLSGGSVGTGSLSPLYQVGGPRSIQFALKVMF